MFKLVDLLSILCFNHIKYFDEDTTTTKHIAHTPFQIDKNSGEEEAQNSLTYRFCNLTFTWLQAIDVKMSSTSDMICENQSKETYLIGLVLGLITLVLWIMLWRKKKRLQLEQIYLSEAIADTKKKASISTAGSSSSLQRKPSSKSLVASSLNRSNQKNAASINDDEDGHMSDSAISFITNLARPKGPRFRKRDKLYFYGKKMLRSVRGSISRADKSRDFYRILSKKLLSKNNDEQPAYRRGDPSQFLVDIETSSSETDHHLPSALINLIRSVKVFGYLDQKIILEMCKYMETKTIYANNYLFKIGEPDDSIYVVESGRVHVYITDEKGRKHLIKECTDGNHIFSLLSIMDVLTGDTKPYKTVSAKAVENTSILRLPGQAFVDVLKKYPDYLVRITQIIIVRLQRVTFTALHNYLGLTSEIIKTTSSDMGRLKRANASSAANHQHQHRSKSPTDEADKQNTSPSSQHHVHHYHHYNHHHHHHHHHHELAAAASASKDRDSGSSRSTLVHHSSNQLVQQQQQNYGQQMSVDSVNSNDETLGLSRKNSLPLPPVGFFAESSGNESSSKETIRKKQQFSAADSKTIDSLKKNRPPTPIEEHLEPVVGSGSKESIKTSKSGNDEQTIPADRRSTTKRRSKSGSSSSASSSHKMETASSDDMQSSDEGSEFGEFDTLREHQRRLPQIRRDMANILNLKDPELLAGKVDLTHVSEGTVLCKEGDYNCSLIFVLDGLCFATQKELNGEESLVFHCYPNQFCGNLSIISGEPSLFSIKAKYNSDLAIITKENFHKLLSADPTVVLSVAHVIVKRMSPFVRQIDFALEWNLIESGNALFRQDTKAENIYIVLNGRLRSILRVDEKSRQLVGEYGRGDLVGLVEILMETNNATTVVAIRDTEVAQIPSGLLNYIKYRHPRVVSRLIQMLSSKLLGTIQSNTTPTAAAAAAYVEYPLGGKQPIDAPTIVSNLCTVAILPVSADVPLHAFTMQLCHALNAIDSSLILTKDLITDKLGPSALDNVNAYRLCAWLGQQEDHNRIVLYQCESQLTPWTRRCMRQADCLLIVGLAFNQPNLGQLEKEIDNFAIRAQKELVLLHKMDGSRPTNTVNWLNARNWCSSHHHIRCPDKLLKTGNNEKLIKQFQIELSREKVDKRTDFSRLARFLTGTSIGVVLGGGGARGTAHVGMIKAMLEANIPIDMIGGTSIGSFMGALWAEENSYERFEQRAREWSLKMTSYTRQVLDLTYPVTSMFTGHAFNKGIEDVFGHRQIEDLWIPYFCITTDISSSKMRVHTNGTIWRYVRASMSYVWLFPPLCDPFDGHLLGSLWRYVRSSMSLSGYLPPLCDPIDGHLLLDGGYVNNLPADVMHRMGVNTVLAIDVGSKDDDNFDNYGDELSGWWLLWKKWNHWAKPVKVPDLTEIQSRLAYVSCQRGLEMVKNSDYCEYMRPPIDKYRTLQFGNFDEIKEVGYNYGKILFDTWIKHGGSIEKFIYRKMKKSATFARGANKDSSPHEFDSAAVARANKKANMYHFEDLSQFVYTPNKNEEEESGIAGSSSNNSGNRNSGNNHNHHHNDKMMNSSYSNNDDDEEFFDHHDYFRKYIRMRSADDATIYDEEFDEEDDEPNRFSDESDTSPSPKTKKLSTQKSKIIEDKGDNQSETNSSANVSATGSAVGSGNNTADTLLETVKMINQMKSSLSSDDLASNNNK